MVIGMGVSILIARRGQADAPFILNNLSSSPPGTLLRTPIYPFFYRYTNGSAYPWKMLRSEFFLSIIFSKWKKWEAKVCVLVAVSYGIRSAWDGAGWAVSFSYIIFLNEKWATELWVSEWVKRVLKSPWATTTDAILSRFLIDITGTKIRSEMQIGWRYPSYGWAISKLLRSWIYHRR
jgi:hypothetical protein